VNWLFRFVSWVFGLFVKRTRAAGAEEQRMKTNNENLARLQRQNTVAQKPVTDAELDKNLRDGTF